MTAGFTYNSHIDYDTLKGGKGSPGNVCKTEPAAPKFSILFQICFRRISKKTEEPTKRVRNKIQDNILTHKTVARGGDLNK